VVEAEIIDDDEDGGVTSAPVTGELALEDVIARATASGIKESKLKIELNKMHPGVNLEDASAVQLADLADWIESV